MLSCLLTFVAVAVLGAHAVLYCPPHLQRGGHLETFRNKCFSFHPEREQQFDTAENFCREVGGHLAIIRDIETQQFLYHIMHDQLSYGGEVWIGLNDKNTEGTFVWNDGSAASFTYWASGQPNNFWGIGDSAENCVFMDMSDQGKWHDGLCNDLLFLTHRKPFICEYTDTYTTTSATAATTLRPTPRQTATTRTQPPRTTRAATAKATTAAATTRTVASVRTEAQTTTSADSACPAFECNKDCGLSGYTYDVNGCVICQCNA